MNILQKNHGIKTKKHMEESLFDFILKNTKVFTLFSLRVKLIILL